VEDAEIPVSSPPNSAVDDAAVKERFSAIEAAEGGNAKPTQEAGRGPGAVYKNTSLIQKSAEPDQSYLQAPPLTQAEVKSVRKLIDLFFKYERGRNGLNDLIRELKVNGLDPVIAKDFNPHTGKMLTIRTNEALEGTRYFHAQYFEDDQLNKEPFRQHLSFEVRPSPDCVKVIREQVESSLGETLGKPTNERGDSWVSWKIGGDSISIHRLSALDLTGDRFNARTTADSGTCVATIEQIPEAH